MAIPEPQFDELYRELILDHYRKPRNRGELPEPAIHAEGLNPVCGDEITLDVRVDGAQIADIAFGGQGCSISQASASMLTDRLKGGTIAQAHEVDDAFRAMLTAGAEPARVLGDLEALHGVAQFPVRVKCALLCWNVLRQALERAQKAEKEATANG